MSDNLKRILQDLVSEDTRVVALVALDGRVIESVAKGGSHGLHAAAGDLAALLKVGAYCTRKLEGGDLDHITLTTDHLAVLAVSMGPAHYLAALLNARGNVARALMSIRRRRGEISEELQ
jgi:predicted regulator of Ras-like GTPase activity (Roadblock/LC7/MglB family)